MGWEKHSWMEATGRGWCSSGEFVCTQCVNDYALKTTLCGALDSDQKCTFCRAIGAAPIDILTEAFVNGLWREYEDADDAGVFYESSEGGYQTPGRSWNTWELIDDYSDALVGEGLADRIKEIVHDREWVERNFVWRRRDDVLHDAWGEFSDAVRYRTRYVIWLIEDPNESEMRKAGEVPPGKVLFDIAGIVNELGLIRELPTTTPLWRAQAHEEPTIPGGPTAARLGTAPRAHAKQSNRMSPAGIPMFYGAEEPATAIAEVARRQLDARRYLTLGRFSASTPMKVVDLTNLPSISMFDPCQGHLSRQVNFLHRFVDDLGRKVCPDDEQIDYVPTQIVTEFFLRAYEISAGGMPSVKGIRYPSTAVDGGISLVIDVGNEHCVDLDAVPANESLRLVLDPASVKTCPAKPA